MFGLVSLLVKVANEAFFVALVFETGLMVPFRLRSSQQAYPGDFANDRTDWSIVPNPDGAVLAPVLLLRNPVSLQGLADLLLRLQ